MEQQNNTIAESVIKKIEQEKLSPISSWHFVLKNSSFWGLWVASVLLGSCAIAGAIFNFSHFGWHYRFITHDSALSFLFDVMPVFWLVSFVGMIAFGFYNLRHTKRGYRFSFALILLVSLILSFVLGTLFFAIGFGRSIDNIKRPLPFAPPAEVLEERLWSNDKRGLVSGFIKSFDKDKDQIVLILPSGVERIISTQELQRDPFEMFEEGDHIKLIGAQDGERFVACVILPWEERMFGKVPPPQNMFERNLESTRINLCKDVRPYQQYQRVLITN